MANTTTSKAKPKSAKADANNPKWVQDVSNALDKMLKNDFPDIRAANSRAKYLILGMWFRESTLQGDPQPQPDVVYNADGKTKRAKPSTTFSRYYSSSTPIVNAGVEVSRIAGISKPHGIGQVMGAYHIRGVERIIIDPNNPEKMKIVNKYGLEYKLGGSQTIRESIYLPGFGEFSGVERGMAASLAVLRDKLRATGTMEKAIASYLGTGVDVVTNLSTSEYLSRVLASANQFENGSIDVTNNSETQVASASGSVATCS